MSKDPVFEALDYLRTHNFVLTTAESCTAGAMVYCWRQYRVPAKYLKAVTSFIRPAPKEGS